MQNSIRNLIFILGDQLTFDISSLQGFDNRKDIVLMAEVSQEASYVPHHKLKIAFIFSAMRHFAQELEQKNCKVEYYKLSGQLQQNPNSSQNINLPFASFFEALQHAVKKFNPEKIIVAQASEYRVLEDIKTWQNKLAINVEVTEDNRFLSSKTEFANYAKGKKSLLMEFFYRQMRKKTGLLMRAGAPIGGKWNFDSENREPIPAEIIPPKGLKFKPDSITKDVIKLVETHFPNNFGSLENFEYAVTKADAELGFEDFINNRLKYFGKYQDATRNDIDFGYHSVIALYLNVGLLNPYICCKKVEQAYFDGVCDINSAEGFIRQIIGWREFIRGVYWQFMPEYKAKNYFNAQNKLPWFYWEGAKCPMNCIRQVVKQTEQNAYSHHIQRLMVTGNFAMLAGINPDEINNWYMAVYADAFEWVELPNTHGMAIYADGGVVGSKPYAASGKYINRMSNFCKSCKYNVNKTTGEGACPFNFLYWNFMINNRQKLEGNMRLKFTYQNLKRKSEAEILEIKSNAENFLKNQGILN